MIIHTLNPSPQDEISILFRRCSEIVWKGIFLLVMITVATAADQSPPIFQYNRYVGYWNDGSGIYAGCTPVTTWNEWDFKRVKNIESLDKENRHNIVWKVPHFNYCNGGMIIVGGKLFALSDRGGRGFYDEKVAEFAGAELFCYDPSTGKELWKIDLDHWDLVPNGAAMRQKVLEYNRQIVPVYAAWVGLGRRLRAMASGAPPLTDEAEFSALSEKIRGLAPTFPKDVAAFKGHKLNVGSYPFTNFGNMLKMYFPELIKKYREIVEVGQYMSDPWAWAVDFLGINMETPVSDGKHVFIKTGYAAMFCVDMDGKIVWKKWFENAMCRGQAIPSPVLYNDIMLTDRSTKKPHDSSPFLGSGQRIALKKSDGSLLWSTQAFSKQSAYQAAPIIMSLPIKGDTAKRVDVAVYQEGGVLRLSDGKLIGRDLGYCGTARPWAVWQNVVCFANGINDGGNPWPKETPYPVGWMALRLTAESEDLVTGEVLWHAKDTQTKLHLPIAKDGLLYDDVNGSYCITDILTGKVVHSAPILTQGNHGGRGYHYNMMAGNHLITLDKSGYSLVAEISADGKTIKHVAQNRLGDRIYGKDSINTNDAFFSYGGQPLASGNRIFIRSMRDLYCIGNPTEPMRLSKEHQ